MRRLALAATSAVVLALLYWLVDPRAVLAALRETDPAPVVVAILLLAIAHLLGAVRLGLLLPTGRRLPLRERLGLILAAAVLNLVVPAKGGDLLKSAFMRGRGGLDGPLALASVTFEKATDLLALLVWCAFGLAWELDAGRVHAALAAAVLLGLIAGVALLASPRFAGATLAAAARVAPRRLRDAISRMDRSWEVMRSHYWRDPRRLGAVGLLSLAIWLLHLLQIWLFARALGVHLPVAAALALTPLAILAGLVPVTLAGVGTRDAALIALLHDYMAPATGAALGVLASLRYLLPGVAGLPVLPRYLAGTGAEPSEARGAGGASRR
jgi:uncharacterized protein (TIRG00374 family)